jgi:hypothetical protein
MIIPTSRHFLEHTYDLHGALSLQVRSPHAKVMRYFDAEFGHFSGGGDRVPDLAVIVDRFQVDSGSQARLCGRHGLLGDGIYGHDSHKVARWRFAIQGLDDQLTRLYLTGGPFSLGFMQHRYVEQLMRYKLCQRGYTLIHGCCVTTQGKAVLLPGLMHTGKTNIALHLVLRGWEFQSDDYTIVSAEGQTHSYPRRLHFSCHVKERYPEALEAVERRHRLSMTWKKVIYLLTLRYGNLTEALSIAEVVPDVVIADTARLEHLILLTTHAGSHLEGPFPIPQPRAVDRALAINRREASHFWNLLVECASMGANIPFMEWWDRERQILENALRRTACYELLVPRQVTDFQALLTQIGDSIERTTGLRSA